MPIPTLFFQHVTRTLAAALLCSPILLGAGVGSAFALSEIPQEEVSPAPADGPIEKLPLPPVGTVPQPDPVTPPSGATDTPPPTEPTQERQMLPEATPPEEPVQQEEATPDVDPDAPVPEIVYDVAKLPEPVRRMRDLIVEAAKSGELEKLRPLIGTGDSATQLTFGDYEGDPLEFLKQTSADGEGQEILAILEEVLSAGFVHVEAGKAEELYIWPYFAAVPLDKLTPPQKVELFKIVTSGEYEEMLAYGAYNFYRAGLTPQGEWVFFIAGD